MPDSEPNPAPTPPPDPTAEKTSANLDSQLRQIMASYHREAERTLQATAAKLRTEIIPALVASSVANIEAVFSGYGDSGAIDGLQYRDKSGLRVQREMIPAGLTEELETCLYEFLPAGFEINDGSQGTLTLDISASRITLTHQENDTGSHDSTREFDL
jgi:hypothetical protein